MSSTKPSGIKMRHPEHTNRDDDGIWYAETEAEAAQLQAAGYERMDGAGPQVAATPGAKQHTQTEKTGSS